MLTYRDIMTKEVVFYEEEYNDVFVKFCKARDISFLPAIHDNNIAFKYSKSKSKRDFELFKIESDLCVESSEKIFKSIAINRFKNSKILFVKEHGELIGVVHYCDYNRPPVFEEIYKKLYKLERGLLYLITKYGNRSIGELEKFKKPESNGRGKRLIEKQDFRNLDLSLIEIMIFASRSKVLTIREASKIKELRNKIAHSNDLIKKSPHKKGELKYNFQSFKELIEGSSALDTALRQVANLAYIKKAHSEGNYELKASQIVEEIFS